MILETRAVRPFMKNGFVLGCEETREGVVIDPGDDVDLLLAAVAAARAVDSLHPADARPPRSHHRCRPREGGARRACRCCTATTTSSTRPSCSRGRRSASHVDPPAAGRSLLRRSGPVALRQLRRVGAPHARPLSRRRLPGGRPRRLAPSGRSSSATRCLPGSSAGPICRAAACRRCCGRSGTCSSAFLTRPSSIQGTASRRRSGRRGGRIRS